MDCNTRTNGPFILPIATVLDPFMMEPNLRSIALLAAPFGTRLSLFPPFSLARFFFCQERFVRRKETPFPYYPCYPKRTNALHPFTSEKHSFFYCANKSLLCPWTFVDRIRPYPHATQNYKPAIFSQNSKHREDRFSACVHAKTAVVLYHHSLKVS